MPLRVKQGDQTTKSPEGVIAAAWLALPDGQKTAAMGVGFAVTDLSKAIIYDGRGAFEIQQAGRVSMIKYNIKEVVSSTITEYSCCVREHPRETPHNTNRKLFLPYT